MSFVKLRKHYADSDRKQGAWLLANTIFVSIFSSANISTRYTVKYTPRNTTPGDLVVTSFVPLIYVVPRNNIVTKYNESQWSIVKMFETVITG